MSFLDKVNDGIPQERSKMNAGDPCLWILGSFPLEFDVSDVLQRIGYERADLSDTLRTHEKDQLNLVLTRGIGTMNLLPSP